MLFDDFTLFDSFQHKGQWWLADKPDNKVYGMLSYSPDDTTLDLFGLFVDETPKQFFESFGTERRPHEAPMIQGLLESGDACTLLNAINTHRSHKMISGFPTSQWSAQWLLIGREFEAGQPIEFPSLHVQFTDLEVWIADLPFQPEWMEAGKNVAYRWPDTLKIEVPVLNAYIGTTYMQTSKGPSYQRYSHEHIAFMTITPRERRDFAWYQRVVLDLQNLLSLLSGEAVYIKRMIAVHDSEAALDWDRRHKARIYTQYAHPRGAERVNPNEMLLPLPDIRDQLDAVVVKWFEKVESLRDVLNLFLGTFYNQRLYLESHFLCLIQAIETFSRSTGPSKYTDDTQYEKINAALVCVINALVPKGSLRQSLTSRISYGNEHSLRRRLDALLCSLDNETIKLISASPRRYRDRVIDTRNFLTHYTKSADQHPVTGTDLLYLNQSLCVLLTILILRTVGLEESLIRQAFAKNSAWRQTIALYQEKLRLLDDARRS